MTIDTQVTATVKTCKIHPFAFAIIGWIINLVISLNTNFQRLRIIQKAAVQIVGQHHSV